MDFIDEQDRARLFLELVDDRLEALLEVAAVFRSSNQCAQVERVDGRVFKNRGNLAIDDTLGQAFRQRGFAHAGFTDIERIVLAATTKHLDGALNLVSAANQGINLAGFGEFVEVAGVVAERIAAFLARFAFACPVGRCLARLGALITELGDTMRQVVDHVESTDFLHAKEVDGVRILLAKNRDQHIGASDFLSTRRLHVIDGTLQHALKTQRRLGVALVAARQHRHRLVDDRLQVAIEFVDVGGIGAQHSQRRWVVEEGQQQVLDGHELMTHLACRLVALADGDFEVLAKHGTYSGNRSRW